MGGLIWLASYPKSGNTWMRAFLYNLLRNPSRPADVNVLDEFCLGESDERWYQRHMSGSLKEVTDEEICRVRKFGHQDMTQAFPDSVFVKTHNYLGEWHDIPIHNMDVTVGGIYIVRNPLDVVLSAQHHFGVDTDQAIVMMADRHTTIGINRESHHIPEYISSWSRHVESWTQNPNPQLLVMRYEDMLEKPRKAFKRVCEFLQLPVKRERLEKAIKFSSFKTLKRIEETKGFKEKSEFSQSFFRSGRSEQWRKDLTEDQIKQIISAHREQMERFDYIPEGY